ncbi:MAG: prepilin-type N-terminal cleavage/methylation domain-containing protein [Candidatus Colwellbacteria bacterium]|nr:prepilin-type N-terminal cleavage/methylation domain-containing protein [Candidatus Colwellbacteria bacterium]
MRDSRGQTLVELMIAMSVMSVGLLSVFAVLSQSLGLNRVVAEQYIASNLAAEGIEVVKNIIDTNVAQDRPSWNEGVGPGTYEVQYDSPTLTQVSGEGRVLTFDPDTGLYAYDKRTSTNFRRVITINSINSNEIQVKSTVTWSSRGGKTFEVVLEDRFFNWRQ